MPFIVGTIVWEGSVSAIGFSLGLFMAKKPPGENFFYFVEILRKGFKVKLLDIDQRFLRIFPPDMFHLFNMMNCHFFTKKHDFESFIQSKNLVIIADPPFGVQVSLGCSSWVFIQQSSRSFKNMDILFSVLMRSLKLLAEKCQKVQFLVFFPWFHHKRFEGYGLRPSDFRVTYAKHSKMNRNKTVRIFTNKLRYK